MSVPAIGTVYIEDEDVLDEDDAEEDESEEDDAEEELEDDDAEDLFAQGLKNWCGMGGPSLACAISPLSDG